VTRDGWLAKHPYLQPVGELHALVDATADAISIPTARTPHWAEYTEDFHAGVPLLQSSKVVIGVSHLEKTVLSLIEALPASALPGTLAEQCRALKARLHADRDFLGLTVAEVLHEDVHVPAYSGLLRYLGWAVMVRYLAPVVESFEQWRNEERWLRNYCPACGAPPAMAQLVGIDPGRLRLLSCGRCRTRWRYRRTGCPFCENRDDHRLAVLDVEGEGGLRIDYCESCRGYLKTYNGVGHETILLADWTSLHLDVIARDRGLKRLAGSLYEL
jgi:FdhE protein